METRGNKRQRGKKVLAAVLATIMLLASAVTAMAEGIIISPQSARMSETVVDGAVVVRKKETVKIGRESEDGSTMNLFTLSSVLGQLEEGYTMAAAKEPLPTFVCASDFEVIFLEDTVIQWSDVRAVEWKEGKHDPSTMAYTAEGYNQTKLYEIDGEKFVNPNDGNTIFKINASWGNSTEMVLVVVDDSYVPETKNETPAEEPTAEEAPAAAEETVLARYTNSTVLVNGTPVEFEAYNINDNNYFKFRDVLMALSETEKNYNVEWDEESQTIVCDYAKYVPVGGELVPGDGTDKTAVRSSVKVIDPDSGSLWSPEAYKAYNINGNNYFKLRDLGWFLGFDVTWDGANNQILIDTTMPYTED